jgi:hypothetical protein
VFNDANIDIMETLAEKIKQKKQTPYQLIADKYNTTQGYVGQIAREERKPMRGKGLKIKKELESLTD